MFYRWFRKIFFNEDPEDQGYLIRSIRRQIKAWRKANRKMGWGIKGEEFDHIGETLSLTESDRHQGFIGTILSYGFGDDGQGNADVVHSGKLAWEYACKNRWRKTWQCEYIDFDKTDHIRLRPGAPVRPKGFYFGMIQTGDGSRALTVSRVRKNFKPKETGLAAEGVQFLTITHTHFQNLMDERKVPLMALADYDVAPYGFNDFFDAAQMFCSSEVLGLGIGNVDGSYPLFGTPTIRMADEPEAIEKI